MSLSSTPLVKKGVFFLLSSVLFISMIVFYLGNHRFTLKMEHNYHKNEYVKVVGNTQIKLQFDNTKNPRKALLWIKLPAKYNSSAKPYIEVESPNKKDIVYPDKELFDGQYKDIVIPLYNHTQDITITLINFNNAKILKSNKQQKFKEYLNTKFLIKVEYRENKLLLLFTVLKFYLFFVLFWVVENFIRTKFFSKATSTQEAPKSSSYSWGLDVFKLLCAIGVVFIHYGQKPELEQLLQGGYLSVDCFFIISGVFLAKVLFKAQATEINLFGFAVKRYKRLMSEVIFLSLIIVLYMPDTNFLNKLLNVLTVTNNMSMGQGFSGSWWYISALFWVSIFIVFLKNIFKKDSSLVFVLLVLMYFSAFIFWQNARASTLNYHQQVLFDAIPGWLPRAILGLGSGIFIYFISKSFDFKKFFNFIDKLQLCKILEFISIFAIFTLFITPDKNNLLTPFSIYLWGGIIVLLALNQKLSLLECVKFAQQSVLFKSSYFLYISHGYIYHLIIRHLSTISIFDAVLIAVFISLIGWGLFKVVSYYLGLGYNKYYLKDASCLKN